MDTKDFVSDLFYLPSVDWYANALMRNKVFVPHCQYNKRFHLNKTNLVSAQGLHALSIPLVGGRNQRFPCHQIQICETENWRQLHLRSIKSMYGRAPFFENIFPYLELFYQQKFTSLYDCNLQSILLINKILKLEIEWHLATTYPDYDRMDKQIVPYTQVFSDTLDFIPHCSILDLVMNEGRNAISILHQMCN